MEASADTPSHHCRASRRSHTSLEMHFFSQHDVQLDYYGKQLASAGSDRRIKIFDVIDGVQRQQTAELVGHDGPVWQLAWAHPEFGNILASCSYDRQVGLLMA